MTRKELVMRALDDSKRCAETCKQEPLSPNADENAIKCWRGIEETRAMAKGRADAFEAVLSAMCGNTHMLKYHARILG